MVLSFHQTVQYCVTQFFCSKHGRDTNALRVKNKAVLTVWICKHPNPCWSIATKAEKKNPQGYKDHIIRSGDDIFKPAAEYNNEAKLRSDHKQKPEFSWNAEMIGVDAIFDMTADSKQNVEDHKAVKNQ